MSGKKTLETRDYLALELHEFTPEVINGMKFGPLSKVLEKHLGTTLNGYWDGSRLFEIQWALRSVGIFVDFYTQSLEPRIYCVHILMRFHPAQGQVVSCDLEYEKGLMSHAHRSEFGQAVGKTALLMLAYRAKMKVDPDTPAMSLNPVWTYNKP